MLWLLLRAILGRFRFSQNFLFNWLKCKMERTDQMEVFQNKRTTNSKGLSFDSEMKADEQY